MDQALNRFIGCDTGGDEDREDDGEACELLYADGAEEKGDPERDGCERVAGVVDQVGEERHRAGEQEDGSLGESGQREYAEAQRHGPDPLARAEDGAIDEAARVAVLSGGRVVVIVAVLVVRMAVVVMSGLVIPLRFQFLWAPVAHEASVIGSG